MSRAEAGTPSKREVLETEMRAIWDARGRLVPADVVEVASDPVHPLHPFFEWSDSAAAEAHRRSQAAALIRSIKVRVTTSDGAGQINDYSVRAWVAPRAAGAAVDEAPPGYVPSTQIAAEPALRDVMLRQMRRDWSAFKRRYEQYEEFWTLIAEPPLSAGDQSVAS